MQYGLTSVCIAQRPAEPFGKDDNPLLDFWEEKGKERKRNRLSGISQMTQVEQGVWHTVGPERKPWCPKHWIQSLET